METFDTNVVVRLLVEDDPKQSSAALRCWKAAIKRDGVFLPKLVLAETIWVLATAYRFDRATILDAVGALLKTENLVVEEGPQVVAALAAFAVGPADFSDYLILEAARSAEGLPVQTFDRRFARHADVALIDLSPNAMTPFMR